ncbi:MAG: 6-pyruvoyltetrahydropterin/6-carboxytetrahydropterin synthase [Planctomycetota bacterium]|jgi:6-pyruvoyltetrahydropterin/6-carboxytetrahydropterin synthase
MSKLPVVEIRRREDFCAAHRLHAPKMSDADNLAVYGPCNTLHGHNYSVEATVRGVVAPETGMVMNLVDLMRLLKERVIDLVDHKYLNTDVPFLEDVIPTAENLAVAFWERLQPEIEKFQGCQLIRIRLYESQNNVAEYSGQVAT